MTSLRQRAANRRNALHSTGPRTAVGRRRVATNALSHGLSVPVDPLTQYELVNPILDRLAAEDLPEPVRLELAMKIADFERNIAHQRQHFADSISGQEPTPRDVLGIDEVFIEDILLSFLEHNFVALRRWGDRQAKRELNEELRSTERYYRRAANQLIKTLRAL